MSHQGASKSGEHSGNQNGFISLISKYKPAHCLNRAGLECTAGTSGKMVGYKTASLAIRSTSIPILDIGSSMWLA